jgi:hypothetical protein
MSLSPPEIFLDLLPSMEHNHSGVPGIAARGRRLRGPRLRRTLHIDEKEKAVLDAMKKEGKPMRPGDIATKAGMDKDEVAKIIDSLKKEGKVASPKRCFYEPV